jgi:hypothetical protein
VKDDPESIRVAEMQVCIAVLTIEHSRALSSVLLRSSGAAAIADVSLLVLFRRVGKTLRSKRRETQTTGHSKAPRPFLEA